MKKFITSALALVLGVSVLMGTIGCKKEEAGKEAPKDAPKTETPAK